MSKIIVGVDESPGSTDAIALASSLAGMTGAKLMLVNVFPYDTHPSRAVNDEFEDYLRQDSDELLERLRSAHGDETVEIKAIPNPSSAHGLHELAEKSDAGLIVVGSTHTGRAGRVTARQHRRAAAARLAVPGRGRPEGLRARPSGASRASSAAATTDPDSAHRALQTAHRLAAATGARLRVIRAFQPLAYDAPPRRVSRWAASSYNDTLRDRASDELDEAVAKLDGEPRAEPFFAVGDAARDPHRGVRAARPAASSAPAATARFTPCWSAASPGASCATRPAP